MAGRIADRDRGLRGAADRAAPIFPEGQMTAPTASGLVSGASAAGAFRSGVARAERKETLT